MSRVEVRSSPIEGLGVFSLDDVAEGEVVRAFALGREVTPEAPLRAEDGERPEHCTLVDGRLHLVPYPDRHFNHSCDPNTWIRHGPGRADAVARRAIRAGEELTLDYLIDNPGGDSWPCRCGAARCRGETGTSFFELPEPFRREYRPLLSDWFVARYGHRLR